MPRLSKAQRKRLRDDGATKADIERIERALGDDDDDDDGDDDEPSGGSGRRVVVYEGDDVDNVLGRIFGTGKSKSKGKPKDDDDDDTDDDDDDDEPDPDDKPRTGPRWFGGNR